MKKKILFINGHMHLGGVEKSLLDILQHTNYDKYDVDLLLIEDSGEYIKDIPQDVNIIHKSLQNAYGPFFKVLFKCLREKKWRDIWIRILLTFQSNKEKRFKGIIQLLLGKQQYDCAIAFRTGICTELVAYGVNAHRKYTWWHHGEFNLSGDALIAYKDCAKVFNKIIAVSDSCKTEILQMVPNCSIEVIPNIVDVQTIIRKANQPLTLPAVKGNKIIVSVSRIAPEKHFENVVYTVEKLLEKGIEGFRWYIIGGGWDFEKIKASINSKGLEKKLIMKGFQANPYMYIQNAALFVHSSYIESQGLAILEAMALGVPCVVTKSRGPCEFIEDGVNGILTEQSPESLAEQVERMLTDEALYQRIKTNTRCPEKFSPERVMRNIEALFEG